MVMFFTDYFKHICQILDKLLLHCVGTEHSEHWQRQMYLRNYGQRDSVSVFSIK